MYTMKYTKNNRIIFLRIDQKYIHKILKNINIQKLTQIINRTN
jgi:hypothetical protein